MTHNYEYDTMAAAIEVFKGISHRLERGYKGEFLYTDLTDSERELYEMAMCTIVAHLRNGN